MYVGKTATISSGLKDTKELLKMKPTILWPGRAQDIFIYFEFIKHKYTFFMIAIQLLHILNKKIIDNKHVHEYLTSCCAKPNQVSIIFSWLPTINITINFFFINITYRNIN